ncbi:MAG: ATP-binding protein [Phototrophicaceae bacterium]|jgi:serine/threonine-protein kinase RsbW
MANEHRLRIVGEINQVRQACSWLVEVAEEGGMGIRDVNHLELAVDEAVTNIIEHGYQHTGADKMIDLVVRQDPDFFIVTIIDEGPPFDPLQVKDPDPLADLDERPDSGGGLGLFFIKRMMDSVHYEYTEHRNHLVLTKRRPKLS